MLTIYTPEGNLEYSNKSSLIKRINREKDAWSFLSDIRDDQISAKLRDLDRGIGIRYPNNIYNSLISTIENNQSGNIEITILSNVDEFWKMPPLIDSPEGAAALRAKSNGNYDLCFAIIVGTISNRIYDYSQIKNLAATTGGAIYTTQAAAKMAAIFDLLNIKEAIGRKTKSAIIDLHNELEQTIAYSNEIRKDFDTVNQSFRVHENNIKGMIRRKTLFAKGLKKRDTPKQGASESFFASDEISGSRRAMAVAA